MLTPVVTRFAPSPTGFLHIGGARTALFNWLYARGRGGTFALRIEDTDRQRSTPEAREAILNGLTWLGLNWDGEPMSQHAHAKRHVEIAYQLLEEDKAYKCFSTAEEINAFRKRAKDSHQDTRFHSPWRDSDPSHHPNMPYAIRIKAPRSGATIIKDQVQGVVRIENDQLDDMVLVRSDGSPVYMLAVVVDDHDMGVTHVIRGDDHLNNAARQMMIYQAMEWKIPAWIHIPLIHGSDGKKLSKRHGALAVDQYQRMGFAASAMRNYLLRLGWSHGDDEFINDTQALDWFDISGIGKSPARFDTKRLTKLSAQHIAATNDDALVNEMKTFVDSSDVPQLDSHQWANLSRSMYCLKNRASTFFDILEKGRYILCPRPMDIDERALTFLDPSSRNRLAELTFLLKSINWTHPILESSLNEFAKSHQIKFGELASPIRAALAGRTVTPSIFDMMLMLGREETIARINDAATHST
ncbi:MAG: glutamate--tRNA ligase [Aestuariivita sp.]|nr:glutamate--tRNA ligase [Aestuariivita sp.]